MCCSCEEKRRWSGGTAGRGGDATNSKRLE
jgi:hypothetical protein